MFSLVPMNRREMGLFGQMGELLNDPFFKNFGRNDQTFMVDIEDRGDAYILEAELPGMKKEEIDISIDGDCLTIQAKKDEETSKEEKNYIYRERKVGSYVRKFDISNVNAEAIKGDFKDGILMLTMPKKEELKPLQRKIELGD